MSEADKKDLLDQLAHLKDMCGDMRGRDGYYLDGKVQMLELWVQKYVKVTEEQ